MRATVPPDERPLHWIGSSLKDIRGFPPDVQRTVGFALGAAQFGGRHPSAKPWKGEGAGVIEIVRDFDGDTYRAVYTVRFAQAIYVLHAFQKKSTHGVATRQADVALIKSRLRAATEHHQECYG